MKLTKKLGMLLLSIWLVMTGLMQMVSVPIPFINNIMALLAIASGVLLYLGK